MRSGTAAPDYRCWSDNIFLADKRNTRVLLTTVAALSTIRYVDQPLNLAFTSLHALLMINFLGKFSFPFGFSISLSTLFLWFDNRRNFSHTKIFFELLMTFTFPSALNYSFPISCARETKENFNFSPFYFISFLYFSPHFLCYLKISSKTFPFCSLRGKFSRSRVFRFDNNSIERDFLPPTSLDFRTVTPKR